MYYIVYGWELNKELETEIKRDIPDRIRIGRPP